MESERTSIRGTDQETKRLIESGTAVLGIELGSTRIKACLIAPEGVSLATGSSEWESRLVDGHWTYGIGDVWSGVAGAVADLRRQVQDAYDAELTSLASLGVSGMMHGYLAFDSDDQLLVPFRTWRDTTTARSAAELTQLLDINIPMRWTVAHLYQAILDREEHVAGVDYLTTLAGYVHWQLTGEKVLGIGDASGMFPVDPQTGDFDAERLAKFDSRLGGTPLRRSLRSLLPRVMSAGTRAGTLTARGAELLDPSGALRPGTTLCPPEGDAGTGMVATNSVRPRTGNVSVGTSIFAMVVLERPVEALHTEIDLVATPDGATVAMVHCNNGADELRRWVSLFKQAAVALGGQHSIADDDAFRVLLSAAEDSAADADGIVIFNNIAGEPVTGLVDGLPLMVRSPGSQLNLGNLMRAQVYSVFASLAIGMEVLGGEGVEIDSLNAHGGIFRTAGIAQRFLAAAAGTPTVVSESAGDGGAWGIALLAAYLDHADKPLAQFLDCAVFSGTWTHTVTPTPSDMAGFRSFLDRYRRGLPVEAAAAELLS
ncbi:xylulokinase [Brevibacterium casei]|uniref:Sugar (Pentulose or hexulose) kinase n=1 Tax=Brevibacterium casei CIP 102111 TaxID=1255625 RepID=A0A2H1JL90_9MICO|nr:MULTISPECIES: FGGY-family carbohydrate kinase [Brevibacterium]QPR39267.1 ATPase [Brevibacterium casei]QPR43433.1 ATPase [Brevibacterium casei]SMX88219.1 Sugar (pentulose or hexulose) kinase [Brevibacterium casei CIP 102111]